MATWTDELKEQVVEMYEKAQPTPENSTEIIKDIAEQIEMSPNGVRMVLVQAGVYVKKDPATKPAAAKKESTGGTRVNKESALQDLRDAITAKGATVDEDIVGKLTGKAAIYFATVLKA